MLLSNVDGNALSPDSKFSVLGSSGMKLIRYYGKGRNFDSIWCVKKRENSDRKNSYFFNLCSAAFTIIVFFTLVIVPQSISSQCFN